PAPPVGNPNPPQEGGAEGENAPQPPPPAVEEGVAGPAPDDRVRGQDEAGPDQVEPVAAEGLEAGKADPPAEGDHGQPGDQLDGHQPPIGEPGPAGAGAPRTLPGGLRRAHLRVLTSPDLSSAPAVRTGASSYPPTC